MKLLPTGMNAAEARAEAERLGMDMVPHYVPEPTHDGKTFVWAGYACVEREPSQLSGDPTPRFRRTPKSIQVTYTVDIEEQMALTVKRKMEALEREERGK